MSRLHEAAAKHPSGRTIAPFNRTLRG